MTDLLYLPDEDDVTDFEATVVEANVAEGRSNRSLLPDHVEELRVVEIGDFDMCPCGGTHVDRTGEISPIEITNRLSKGADVERIEFELREN